jgi:hypothetical protein
MGLEGGDEIEGRPWCAGPRRRTWFLIELQRMLRLLISLPALVLTKWLTPSTWSGQDTADEFTADVHNFEAWC